MHNLERVTHVKHFTRSRHSVFLGRVSCEVGCWMDVQQSRGRVGLTYVDSNYSSDNLVRDSLSYNKQRNSRSHFLPLCMHPLRNFLTLKDRKRFCDNLEQVKYSKMPTFKDFQGHACM